MMNDMIRGIKNYYLWMSTTQIFHIIYNYFYHLSIKPHVTYKKSLNSKSAFTVFLSLISVLKPQYADL